MEVLPARLNVFQLFFFVVVVVFFLFLLGIFFFQFFFSNRSTLKSSLFFQTEQGQAVNDQNPHVSNIGRMIEDMEMKLRTTLNTIYFGKTKDIVNELRQASGASAMAQRAAFAADISSSLASRG